MTINIEILTKKDCCLCDDAKAIIECVLNDYPATLKLIDIESDPVLFASYKGTYSGGAPMERKVLFTRRTKPPCGKNWTNSYNYLIPPVPGYKFMEPEKW